MIASASTNAPGWVAFVTADGVRHTERLSVTTPTVVAWEEGIRIAPYVRALTEAKVVIVLLGDARKAAIYRLLEGRIEEVARRVAAAVLVEAQGTDAALLELTREPDEETAWADLADQLC